MDRNHLLQEFLSSLQGIEDSKRRDGSRNYEDIAARSIWAVTSLIRSLPTGSIPDYVHHSLIEIILLLDDQQKQRGDVSDNSLSRVAKNVPPDRQQMAAGYLYRARDFLFMEAKQAGQKISANDASKKIAGVLRTLGAKREEADPNEIYNRLRTDQKHIIFSRKIQTQEEFESALRAYLMFRQMQ